MSTQLDSLTKMSLNLSCFPIRSIDETLTEQEALGLEVGGIEIRLLHALQLVISLVAAPILLMIGLLEAAVRTGLCQFNEVKEILQLMGIGISGHLFIGIPVALTGTFTTAKLADELRLTLHPFQKTIINTWTCGAGIDL